MPRDFFPATAEQVVAVVDAVLIRDKADVAFAAEFADLPQDQAESALKLAVDLGLLGHRSGAYSAASPLCRALRSPKEAQRAAALRVVLESFEPFVTFRERLGLAPLAATAAQQTKVTLALTAHREDIKDTLVNLGTYSQALATEGGGRYRAAEVPLQNALTLLAEACAGQLAAEGRIREQLGYAASAAVSRDEVLIPLADALVQAAAGDGRGAVVRAGNAVESFLAATAPQAGVNVTNANGLNAKLDRYDQAAALPKKLVYVGKYLGHVRNAADHGVDADVGAAWTIRRNTGTEYVFVACSFVAAVVLRRAGGPPEI